MQSGECRIPHQTLLEFYAVVTRQLPGLKESLLTSGEAREESEVLLLTSIVLYPVENVVRLGLYATATFGLNWFDAHLWAYAEHYRCSIIYSEDFEHGRYYGSIRVVIRLSEGRKSAEGAKRLQPGLISFLRLRPQTR